MNNLAELYRVQAKYVEAEALYKRAMAVLEKALGPEHPHVANVLENMAKRCRNMGKEEEAEKLEARVKEIQSKR